MSDAGLPIVNLAANANASDSAADVHAALSRRGFMYVRGHGVQRSVLDAAFDAAKQFFALPVASKNAFAYTSVAANFGYQGLEAERLDPRKPADLKEAFTMRNALAGASSDQPWPSPEFRDAALRLYADGLEAAQRLLEIIAVCLELPRDAFRQRHSGQNVTLRFLHYPANSIARSVDQLGAGAHTDYGSITVLFQDSVGGLELLGPDREWQAAPPVEDAVVINTGDLIERWSNGCYPSTVHRVRPITGSRDRYSIALFIDPDSDVEVAPVPSCIGAGESPRYSSVLAGEFIASKIAATH